MTETVLVLVRMCTSIIISISSKIELFFHYWWYRFQPKRKIVVLASLGFGRNEKKPFGLALFSKHLFKSAFPLIDY